MTKPGLARKLLVAAVSTVVFSAAAYFAWPYLAPQADTVEIVDTTKDLLRLAEERGAAELDAAVASDALYPPQLVREPLSEATATLFFPALNRKDRCEFNELEYVRRRAGHKRWFAFAEHPAGGVLMQANSMGFRGAEEVAETKPDLRILLTGDSHIDGVCAHEESCVSELERRLAQADRRRSIEVINAGTGAHCLFNYLGTFERFATLQPDVYIVVVYGGNDFVTTTLLDRHFRRSRPFKTKPYSIEIHARTPAIRSLMPQEFVQDIYFANNPEDLQRAIDVSCSISVELDRLCSAQGTDLLFVYLPPPTLGQPQHFQAERELLLSSARIDIELTKSSELIADAWMAFLAEREFEFIDLRESFLRSEERLYWLTDHHLNIAGHRLLAEILFEHFNERQSR